MSQQAISTEASETSSPCFAAASTIPPPDVAFTSTIQRIEHLVRTGYIHKAYYTNVGVILPVRLPIHIITNLDACNQLGAVLSTLISAQSHEDYLSAENYPMQKAVFSPPRPYQLAILAIKYPFWSTLLLYRSTGHIRCSINYHEEFVDFYQEVPYLTVDQPELLYNFWQEATTSLFLFFSFAGIKPAQTNTSEMNTTMNTEEASETSITCFAAASENQSLSAPPAIEEQATNIKAHTSDIQGFPAILDIAQKQTLDFIETLSTSQDPNLNDILTQIIAISKNFQKTLYKLRGEESKAATFELNPTPVDEIYFEAFSSSQFLCVPCKQGISGRPALDAHHFGRQHINKCLAACPELFGLKCDLCDLLFTDRMAARLHVVTAAHRLAYWKSQNPEPDVRPKRTVASGRSDDVREKRKALPKHRLAIDAITRERYKNEEDPILLLELLELAAARNMTEPAELEEFTPAIHQSGLPLNPRLRQPTLVSAPLPTRPKPTVFDFIDAKVKMPRQRNRRRAPASTPAPESTYTTAFPPGPMATQPYLTPAATVPEAVKEPFPHMPIVRRLPDLEHPKIRALAAPRTRRTDGQLVNDKQFNKNNAKLIDIQEPLSASTPVNRPTFQLRAPRKARAYFPEPPLNDSDLEDFTLRLQRLRGDDPPFATEPMSIPSRSLDAPPVFTEELTPNLPSVRPKTAKPTYTKFAAESLPERSNFTGTEPPTAPPHSRGAIQRFPKASNPDDTSYGVTDISTDFDTDTESSLASTPGNPFPRRHNKGSSFSSVHTSQLQSVRPSQASLTQEHSVESEQTSLSVPTDSMPESSQPQWGGASIASSALDPHDPLPMPIEPKSDVVPLSTVGSGVSAALKFATEATRAYNSTTPIKHNVTSGNVTSNVTHPATAVTVKPHKDKRLVRPHNRRARMSGPTRPTLFDSHGFPILPYGETTVPLPPETPVSGVKSWISRQAIKIATKAIDESKIGSAVTKGIEQITTDPSFTAKVINQTDVGKNAADAVSGVKDGSFFKNLFGGSKDDPGSSPEAAITTVSKKLVDSIFGKITFHIADVACIILDVAGLLAGSADKTSVVLHSVSLTARIIKAIPQAASISGEVLKNFFSQYKKSVLSGSHDNSVLRFFKSLWKSVHGTLPSSKTVKNFFSTFGSLGKNLSGMLQGLTSLTTIGTWIKDFATSVYVWVAMRCTNPLTQLSWVKGLKPTVQHIAGLTLAYELLKDPSRLVSFTGRSDLNLAIERMKSIETHHRLHNPDISYPRHLSWILQQLEEAKKNLALDTLSDTQMMPYALYLYSGTQRGKSSILHEIASINATTTHRPSGFYTAPVDAKHHDNYTGQAMIAIEEYAQNPDYLANQTALVFQALTTVRPVLSMAAVEKKSGDASKLDANLVVATSNVSAPDPGCAEKDAFYRRWDAVFLEFTDDFCVKVHDHFAHDDNGMRIPNGDAIRQYRSRGANTFEILNFRFYKMADNPTIDQLMAIPPLSFNKFRAELVSRITQHAAINHVYDHSWTSTLKSAVLSSSAPLTPLLRMKSLFVSPKSLRLGDVSKEVGIQTLQFTTITNRLHINFSAPVTIKGVIINTIGEPLIECHNVFPTSVLIIRSVTKFNMQYEISILFKDERLDTRNIHFDEPRKSCTKHPHCPAFSVDPKCVSATKPFPQGHFNYSELIIKSSYRFSMFPDVTTVLSGAKCDKITALALNPFSRRNILAKWYERSVEQSSAITQDWIYYCYFLATEEYAAPLVPTTFTFSASLSNGSDTNYEIVNLMPFRDTIEETHRAWTETLTTDSFPFSIGQIAEAWTAIPPLFSEGEYTQWPASWASKYLDSLDCDFIRRCAVQLASRGEPWPDHTVLDLENPLFHWHKFTQVKPCIDTITRAFSISASKAVFTHSQLSTLHRIAQEDPDLKPSDLRVVMGKVRAGLAVTPHDAWSALQTYGSRNYDYNSISPDHLKPYFKFHVDKDVSPPRYYFTLKEGTTELSSQASAFVASPETFQQNWIASFYATEKDVFWSYTVSTNKKVGLAMFSEFKKGARAIIDKIDHRFQRALNWINTTTKAYFTKAKDWIMSHKALSAIFVLALVGLSGFAVYKLIKKITSIFVSSSPIKKDNAWKNVIPVHELNPHKPFLAEEAPVSAAPCIWNDAGDLSTAGKFLVGSLCLTGFLSTAVAATLAVQGIWTLTKVVRTPPPSKKLTDLGPCICLREAGINISHWHTKDKQVVGHIRGFCFKLPLDQFQSVVLAERTQSREFVRSLLARLQFNPAEYEKFLNRYSLPYAFLPGEDDKPAEEPSDDLFESTVHENRYDRHEDLCRELLDLPRVNRIDQLSDTDDSEKSFESVTAQPNRTTHVPSVSNEDSIIVLTNNVIWKPLDEQTFQRTEEWVATSPESTPVPDEPAQVSGPQPSIKPVPATPGEFVKLNLSTDIPLWTSFYNVVRQNTVAINVTTKSDSGSVISSTTLNGIRIRDREVVFNAHLLVSAVGNIRNSSISVLVRVPFTEVAIGWAWFQVNWTDVATLDGRDLAMLLLPVRTPAAKDIRHLFSKPTYVDGKRVIRPAIGVECSTLVSAFNKNRDYVCTPLSGVISTIADLTAVGALSHKIYNTYWWHPNDPSARTRAGHCGSPLFIRTNAGPCIIGLHCADNSQGIATSIDRTDLADLSKALVAEPINDAATVSSFSYTLLAPRIHMPPGFMTHHSSVDSKTVPPLEPSITEEGLLIYNSSTDAHTLDKALMVVGTTPYAPRSGDDILRSKVEEDPLFPLTVEPANLNQTAPDTVARLYSGITKVIQEPSAAFMPAAFFLARRDAAQVEAPFRLRAFHTDSEYLNGTLRTRMELLNIPTIGRPPMASSASFPWNRTAKVTQMKHLVQEIFVDKTMYYAWADKIKDPMRKAIDRMLSCWSKSEIGHVAGGFMKSEKRPLTGPPTRSCKYCSETLGHVKVDTPRVIGCPSKEHSVAIHFLFGSWASARTHSRSLIGNKIGMDIHSEWDSLARSFRMKKFHLASDYKFFDKTIGVRHSHIVAISAYYFMFGIDHHYEERFKSDYNQTRTERRDQMMTAAFPNFPDWLAGKISFKTFRHNAFTTFLSASASIVTMYTMFQNQVLWSGRGETSGVKITGDFNGCINEALLYSAFAEVSKCSLEEVDKDLLLALYGDDNISGWDKLDVTFPKLAQALFTYGMIITPANKSDVMEDHIPYEELTFLKRSFRYDSDLQQYRAPLEMPVINNMAYWYRKSLPHRTALIVNANQMIKEYAEHEPGILETRLPRIAHFLKLSAIALECPSRLSLLRGEDPLFNGVPAPAHLLVKE